MRYWQVVSVSHGLVVPINARYSLFVSPLVRDERGGEFVKMLSVGHVYPEDVHRIQDGTIYAQRGRPPSSTGYIGSYRLSSLVLQLEHRLVLAINPPPPTTKSHRGRCGHCYICQFFLGSFFSISSPKRGVNINVPQMIDSHFMML